VAIEPQINKDTFDNTTGRGVWVYPAVAVSVVGMADPSAHLTHDELDVPSRLRADGEAVGRTLGLGQLGRLGRLERIADAAVAGAPSLAYDDFPREVGKRDVEVTEAAARIAAALNLYLD
jgi:hypothetical protein